MSLAESSVEMQKSLLAFMLATDRNGANLMVDGWAAQKSYELAVSELLEPGLQQFGDIWANKEDVTLAQAYVAAKIAEDIMLKAALSRPERNEGQPLKGPVVLGNIEDDYHALGRKMVASFLRADGWQVIDLGNDVLAEEFVDAAQEAGAKVIGASAMMHVNAVNILKLRAEIDRRGLTGKIQLVVGGAVFVLRPQLVAEVGGDGTARNALEASKVMAELWARAEAAGG